MEVNKIYLGKNLDVLKTFPDNSIDSVVTDPPYGLGKEPNVYEVMKSWVETGYHEIKGKGFMGKEWDSFVPQPIFWKEVYRVLKPGGFVLSFAGTRTYDWMVMAIRFAGFEVRDMIGWLYGSGFPKSLNIGIAIDKLNGVNSKIISNGRSGKSSHAFQSEETTTAGGYEIKEAQNEWQGFGTALKPAHEDIVLAQKPLEISSVLVYNDITEVALCLLKSFVLIVEKNLVLNQQEQLEVQNIVQWIAENSTNILGNLQEVMAMLQLLKMENMNLNIVLLWLNTLEEIYKLKNTSITEMATSLIIELKILKSLEWENIFQSIILPKGKTTDGIQQNVLLAEKNFNDLIVKLDYIHTHFVQENVTSLEKRKNLSPNNDPIVLARKPVEGTVAENVLKWGVGGLNIDGCRVETEEEWQGREMPNAKDGVTWGGALNSSSSSSHPLGRFPANVILSYNEDEYELKHNINSTNKSKVLEWLNENA